MLGSQSAPGSAGFEATAHSLLVVDLLLLLCDSDLVRLFGRIARGLAHQSPAPAAMGGSAVCASEDHKSGDYRRTLFAGVECGLTSPSSASPSSSSPLVHIQAPCISVEPPLGNEAPPRYASARATERERSSPTVWDSAPPPTGACCTGNHGAAGAVACLESAYLERTRAPHPPPRAVSGACTSSFEYPQYRTGVPPPVAQMHLGSFCLVCVCIGRRRMRRSDECVTG